MMQQSPFANVESASPIAATITRNVQVLEERGLTMLTCSRFVEHFRQFTGKVTVSNGEISVDGRSILEMLQLAAVAGTVLCVELVGPDADQLMQRVVPVLAHGI
jgi:phosphotransferase system HPr (HPr) family protein